MLTQKCQPVPTHRSKMTLLEPEVIIKMSFLLSVSNGSRKSEEFSLNDTEVLKNTQTPMARTASIPTPWT